LGIGVGGSVGSISIETNYRRSGRPKLSGKISSKRPKKFIRVGGRKTMEIETRRNKRFIPLRKMPRNCGEAPCPPTMQRALAATLSRAGDLARSATNLEVEEEPRNPRSRPGPIFTQDPTLQRGRKGEEWLRSAYRPHLL